MLWLFTNEKLVFFRTLAQFQILIKRNCEFSVRFLLSNPKHRCISWWDWTCVCRIISYLWKYEFLDGWIDWLIHSDRIRIYRLTIYDRIPTASILDDLSIQWCQNDHICLGWTIKKKPLRVVVSNKRAAEFWWKSLSDGWFVPICYIYE